MPQFWSVTIMILIQFWLELQALDHFFVAFHQCLVFFTNIAQHYKWINETIATDIPRPDGCVTSSC